MGGYTHTLPWVEQSSGPSHLLLLVPHGWTWELGLSFQFCFLVITPGPPHRLAPAHLCFPRLEGEIPAGMWAARTWARVHSEVPACGERVGQLPRYGMAEADPSNRTTECGSCPCSCETGLGQGEFVVTACETNF